MWYLAEILFAQPKRRGRRMYVCDSCNVLFEAKTAKEAYRKALAWAKAPTAGAHGNLKLLGVSHLSSIGEERKEGVDICGRFFQKRDVWDKIADLVPARDELRAILLERNWHTPAGQLMTPYQMRMLRLQLDSES